MKRHPSFRNRGLQITHKSTNNNDIRARLDQILANDFEKLRKSKDKNSGIIQCSTCSNNPVVMEYIRTIYQQYNIPDPMRNFSQQQLTFMKPRPNSFYDANNQSGKHYNSRKLQRQETGTSIVKFQYSTPRKQDSTMLANTTMDRPVSSQYSRRILLGQNSRYANSHSSQHFVTPKIAKSKHVKTFSVQQQISRMITKTKQSFRYCIACQNPILQANIQSHQMECSMFSQLYAMDLTQILVFLNEKICKIRTQLIQKKSSIKEQDANKISINIESVLEKSLIILNSGSNNSEFEKNYNQAMEISSRWGKTAQEINKLRWFLKIRENLKIYFGC